MLPLIDRARLLLTGGAGELVPTERAAEHGAVGRRSYGASHEGTYRKGYGAAGDASQCPQ
jgi:hypothetical protein